MAIFRRAIALQHLQEGIAHGLVSEVPEGGWPKNIWSMTENGTPLEAQLDNGEQGSYHGYPLLEDDPFADIVRRRWNGGANE